MTQIKRPNFHRFHNGSKAALPFGDAEYETRLAGLRKILRDKGVNAAVFSSMHNIAYYSGFLYCAFGRPYGLVVTATDCVTISAGIDAGQPWRRSFGDNITYTDWQRDNYWRAIASVTGQGAVIGYEGDHLSLTQAAALTSFLAPKAQVDLAQATMQQRMKKSAAEIALIRAEPQPRMWAASRSRMLSAPGCAKLTWPWRAATQWRRILRGNFQMRSIGTPGSGSNLASTPTGRITP